MKFTGRLFSLALFLAGVCPAAFGAVTFTVTPAAVSNTYSGTITLQVTNIPTGDTVVVQKFLDTDSNGVINGSAVLVQQFNLTDGQAGQVIGSVTNYNVPGDLNSATGAITTTLNFKNGDFVQNLVGKYLYKLSSPVGHFTPLTNSFTVTNFPFAQKFTGNVVSNSTSLTLSNAIVLLFPPPRSGHGGPGQPLGGTVANHAGAYTIMMPAGTYTLLAFYTNFVTLTKKAPVLTLGASQTIITNLTVTNATANISGTFVDAANNAIVLPGVFMPVQSTNNDLLAFSFSDTNGNFNARVTATGWGLGSDDSGLIVHGYVGYNNKLATNSGATGVTLAFSKANALFYGSVKDNLGNPLVGIDVNDYDTTSNLYSMDGYTDTNGNYFVGAVGLGSNDPWQLGLSSESTPTNYDFSQPQFDQNNGTNLNAGTAVLQNFTAILATNTISGNVKDSNGTNIVGVGVSVNAALNGTNYQNFVDTDTNGNYSLNVANGTWDISLNCNGGSDSLSQLGNYACPNDQFPTISDNNATNNFIVQICGGIDITTPSPLPVGEVNVFYDQSIQASDCSGNYNWSQPGGTLPNNLSLNSGGSSYTLSGNPTTSGNFSFTVQVNDGSGNTTNQQYSVAISNAVQIITTTLPNGTNGLNYSQQLQATAGVPFGGASPYSWSLSSNSLPANLNLATNGLLSGSLTTGGMFNFTVQAVDSLGGVYNQPLSLNIVNTNAPPPLAVGTVSSGQIVVLWPASAGTNFTLQMTTNLQSGPWVPATNGVLQNAYSFTNNAPAVFFRLQ
jgi:hypothetical protein